MAFTFHTRDLAATQDDGSQPGNQAPSTHHVDHQAGTHRQAQGQGSHPATIPEEPEQGDSYEVEDMTPFSPPPPPNSADPFSPPQHDPHSLAPTCLAAPSAAEQQQQEAYNNAPRATSGKSMIIRPGEPHHFGNRVDRTVGEVVCTLCRCRTPMAHGDAYTMLSSPRGRALDGSPIDWQTGKAWMLSHYGKEQISHREEIAAIPYVFEAQTAQRMLDAEEHLKSAVRAGWNVGVNVRDNNVSWHNEGGRERSDVTEAGLKTRVHRW